MADKKYKQIKDGGVFPTRLNHIMQERGVSSGELADMIGKSKSSVGYYRHGDVSPDFETLIKIAGSLNVTTDYLLGLTDCEIPNEDARAMQDYTGLSEDALRALHHRKDNFVFTKTEDFLLTKGGLIRVIANYFANEILNKNIKKLPYSLIPVNEHDYMNSVMYRRNADSIYFSEIIKGLPKNKEKFIELYGDNDFIKRSIFRFLSKHADYEMIRMWAGHDGFVSHEELLKVSKIWFKDDDSTDFEETTEDTMPDFEDYAEAAIPDYDKKIHGWEMDDFVPMLTEDEQNIMAEFIRYCIAENEENEND